MAKVEIKKPDFRHCESVPRCKSGGPQDVLGKAVYGREHTLMRRNGLKIRIFSPCLWKSYQYSSAQQRPRWYLPPWALLFFMISEL